MIQIESRNGCPAYGRQPNNLEVPPLKMVAPRIDARIEERHGFAGLGIDRHQTVRLVQITARTDPSQIVENAPSAE